MSVRLVFLLFLPVAIQAVDSKEASQQYTTFLFQEQNYRIAKVAAPQPGYTLMAGSSLLPGPSLNSFTFSHFFVSKLDETGNTIFTVLLGGGSDIVHDLTVDSKGNIYIAGETYSADFPVRNPVQANPSTSGRTGFLVKLSPDGSQVLTSTYFGGAGGSSSVNAVNFDAAGNIYLAGSTDATDFPATEALRAVSPNGGRRRGYAFFAKLPPEADRVLLAGLIGGDTIGCLTSSSCLTAFRWANANAIGVDGAGNIVVAGNTNTTDLPTTADALSPKGIGAFVAKFKADGSGLTYLTYLGTLSFTIAPFQEPANTLIAIAVDHSGDVLIAGKTNDENFPATEGAYQPVYSKPSVPPPNYPPQTDGFVARLKSDGSGMVWSTFLGGGASEDINGLSVDTDGGVWVTGTTVSPDFPNPNGWAEGVEFITGLTADGSALRYSARFPDGTVALSIASDPDGLLHVAGALGSVSTIAPFRSPTPRVFALRPAAGAVSTPYLAPGELIVICGPDIGHSPAVAIGDLPAFVVAAARNDIEVAVPFGIVNQTSATLRVTSAGAILPDFPAKVVPTLPQIFPSPDGLYAAALNEDGTINSSGNPAKAGSVITFWATATGWMDADAGHLAKEARNTSCCTVRINYRSAEVLYAGTSPGLLNAVTQINVRLPQQLNNDSALIELEADGRSASARVFVTPQ
ncbi:MAG: SBBP repeat-containing protein [Bryobacterales bacterium]|nr:SBBP repeat-containing protein [Bryobacterales bacterium]